MINMKIKLNKWIGFITGTFVMLVILNSCVKDRNPSATDFSHLQDHVDIVNGGLTNFGNVVIGFNNGDTTTATLIVNLASVNLPSSAVNVTIGVDSSKIASYNAANGTNYIPVPSNSYTIASTSLTVPAGQQYAQTTVKFYNTHLDPVVSYMLPISIKDASGKLLTGNLNTIYYHIIGNPLAGIYLQDFSRWNGTTDTTTAPNSTVFTAQPVVISPVSGTALLLPENYIQTFVGSTAGVTLSFTNNSGTLSDFAVSLDDGTKSGLTAGGFSVVTQPTLVAFKLVGDQSTHYAGTTIRIFTVLKNSTPAIRTLIDQFVKQ
jgi:hypothetical protein